jgi:mRNA interferase RelE/StbE
MSRYSVYVIPRALAEMKDTPGHIRQRIRRSVQALADNARPSDSKKLVTSSSVRELRRLRLEKWRVVYAITEDERVIDILAVRKRPPYDYGDLAELLAEP